MTKHPNNRAGFEAMNAVITPASRVRRALKAGAKPRRKNTARLTLLDAIKRLCEEADRGRSLMRKYGLDPDDIHLALIYRAADGVMGSSPLPPPGNISAYVQKFEQMGAWDFLGILWHQTPADSKGIVPMWVSEFYPEDKLVAIELLVFKNALAELSTDALREQMQ
jgi:hypothetical protein